jgi:hypothetical protein
MAQWSTGRRSFLMRPAVMISASERMGGADRVGCEPLPLVGFLSFTVDRRNHPSEYVYAATPLASRVPIGREHTCDARCHCLVLVARDSRSSCSRCFA